jgi:mannose-1-phosphate guanylyltransferase
MRENRILKQRQDFILAAVIMAGGKGTRFWPKSRKDLPKQLLNIGTKKPLIVDTVERLEPLIPRERIFISTSEDLSGKIRKILPGISRSNYILEPVGRDTAACVGLATAVLSRKFGPGAKSKVMAVLPADHCISEPARFRKTLLKATKIAARYEVFVTIGIKPSGPSTAYGYIQPGKNLAGERGALWVKRFREKPKVHLAKRLINQGCFWNAGMFIFQPEVGLAAFDRYLPGMAAGLRRIQAAAGTRMEKKLIKKLFPEFEKTSVDYGIMEKADNVAVVPGEFGWSDVGGWEALYRLLGGDGERNVSQGSFIQVDSRGVYSDASRLVAAVGVEDLVIVESDDAILVLRMDQEGEVKTLINLLERRGLKEFL